MKLFFIIFIVLIETPLLSMELDIHTNEGKVVTLSEFTTPSLILQIIQENKEKLDHCFTQKAWNILQNLFLVMKHVSQTDVPLKLESTHPFDDTTPLAAEHVLEFLSLSNIHPDICDQYFHEYMMLVNGDSNPALLSKLADPLKTTLDKYYFLFHDKHLQLSPELYGYVCLKALIKHRRITQDTFKKDILEDNVHNGDNSFTSTLKLDNKYLKSLEGWDLLFTNFSLNPAHIRIIDLSHNKITEILPTLLKGFVNLLAISFAYNSLQAIPDGLFAECPCITEINFSHNKLKGITPVLIALCKELEFLDLTYNDIKTLDKKALSQDNSRLKIVFRPSNLSLLIHQAQLKHTRTCSPSPTMQLALGIALFGGVVLLKVFIFTLRAA